MPRKRPADGSGSDSGSSKTGRKSSGNVSRRISPTETAVISVTRFTSGTSWNIIPETARLEGTVRTFNPKVREQIVKLMQAQAEGLEREGYQVEFTWIPGCPATNNDANLAELVRKEAMEEGFHVTLQHPEMGGEDFPVIRSWFREHFSCGDRGEISGA